MISKNYLNISVKQLFYYFFNTPLLPTTFVFSVFFVPVPFIGYSSFLNYHKLPDLSE